MADTTPKAVAAQLHNFIQAAERKVSASTGQMVRAQPASEARANEWILKIYEECLSKLTDEELAEVDRIVEKMSGTVGDPSGAIPPP